MPIPQIVVFVDPETQQQHKPDEETFEAYLIKRFTDCNLPPLVDSLHWNSYDWFMTNVHVNKNYRLYSADYGKLHDYDCNDLNDEMNFCPDFAIVFNDKESVSGKDWRDVYNFLAEKIVEKKCFDKESSRDGWQFLESPVLQIAIPETEKQKSDSIQKLPEFYNFRHYYLEPRDIMVYEVVKPHTDLPYTTITAEYKEKGHLPFFSSLFISESWGICAHDISFLKQIWTHLKMDGEFDVEKLYRDRVEACTPGPGRIPDAEPIVYRRTLEEIVERYASGNALPQTKNRRRKHSMIDE